MASKSQQELEQPVKYYQLQAVETKLDHALKQLDTIVTQTSGLVTLGQLEEAKKTTKEYIDDEVIKVHLDYKPLKNKYNAIIGTAITAVIVQLIYIIFNLFGSK